VTIYKWTGEWQSGQLWRTVMSWSDALCLQTLQVHARDMSMRGRPVATQIGNRLPQLGHTPHLQHKKTLEFTSFSPYKGVSKSFWTGCLEQELQWYSSLPLGAVVWLFLSQSSEFCCHNPLCCLSTSVYCCKHIFHYWLSPETFGYTLVDTWWLLKYMHITLIICIFPLPSKLSRLVLCQCMSVSFRRYPVWLPWSRFVVGFYNNTNMNRRCGLPPEWW
jgi:hypothetical protein